MFCLLLTCHTSHTIIIMHTCKYEKRCAWTRVFWVCSCCNCNEGDACAKLVCSVVWLFLSILDVYQTHAHVFFSFL